MQYFYFIILSTFTISIDATFLFTWWEFVRIHVVLRGSNMTESTSSSFDGWTLVIQAKGHNELGMLQSYSKTTSLTLTFHCTLFHYFLTLSNVTYPLINRFQYILDKLSTTFHSTSTINNLLIYIYYTLCI